MSDLQPGKRFGVLKTTISYSVSSSARTWKMGQHKQRRGFAPILTKAVRVGIYTCT
jgi:hypothetical protein